MCLFPETPGTKTLRTGLKTLCKRDWCIYNIGVEGGVDGDI